MIRKLKLFTSVAVLCSLMVTFHSEMARSDPDKNPSPQIKLEVIGVIPNNLDAVVVAKWHTTTDFFACKHIVGEAGLFPDSAEETASLLTSMNGRRSWVVWRDYFRLGFCGWRLKEVLVYLDWKDSDMPVVRKANIPLRIAYVCEQSDHCGGNNWGINDDNSKPTFFYCKFSTLRHISSGQSINPCSNPPETTRGTDLGKYEHLLLPDQSVVRFNIVDLEDVH